MPKSVHIGLNPINFIRKPFVQIRLCLSAQRISEQTV